ncbi:MAG: diadenylate cyclase [Christensenellales bacterium]|jgi:diadenylate cyclase
MTDFKTYIENINAFLVIDILIILGLSLPVIIFFIKKNSARLAVLLTLYIILLTLINIVCALSANETLYLSKRVLDYFNIFLIVTFVIVYQSDIKMLLAKLGRPADWVEQIRLFSSDDDLKVAAAEIVKATQNMSKNDIGAIIIVAPSAIPGNIVETGTRLDALVSAELLESIFNPKTPLHDGAVVIKGDIVVAAGCFLPLSQDIGISKDLGTRHRAAIGIAEESDVLAIVVSEESGIISTVRGHEFKRFMTPEKLQEEIENAFGINYKTIKRKERK